MALHDGMPTRRKRDQRRYQIESLTQIMADLDTYINETEHDPHGKELDDWYAHCLYNLSAKLVDVQTTQRAVLEILEDVGTRLVELGKIEKRGRRGK